MKKMKKIEKIEKIALAWGIIIAACSVIWAIVVPSHSDEITFFSAITIAFLFCGLPLICQIVISNNIANDWKRFFYLLSHYGLFTPVGIVVMTLTLASDKMFEEFEAMLYSPLGTTVLVIYFGSVFVMYALAAFWSQK